jgi:tetratricopeptide (TPR) repeat protein
MFYRSSSTLSALVAAVMATSVTALAQYQVENSAGRALDSNLRLGSGGYNDTRALPNGVTSEDVVYGNITRGREFRGNINSTDSRAFRGGTAGRNMDAFVRDSGGALPQGARNVDPSQAQRYLGDSRGVNPPSDYQRESYSSGGFVPAARETGVQPGDMRINATIANPVLDDILFPGNATSELTRLRSSGGAYQGATPSWAQPWAEPASPLNRDDIDMPRGSLRRLNLTNEGLLAMREELRQSAGETPERSGSLSGAGNPSNAALDSRIESGLQQNPLAGTLQTGGGTRQYLLTPLPEATLQSAQYAELRRRLKSYQEQGLMTEEQAVAAEYNAQLRLQQERERQAGRGTIQIPVEPETPGATSVLPQTPGDTPAGSQHGRRAALRDRLPTGESAPGMVRRGDEPMRVTSFAEGIRAPRLKAMLEGAEKAMREGKFTGALDQYDAAAAVAPNNPIILMGRASAELGAGYYARAQAHIEQIFASDEAMLLAQYDLKRFYGDERLQYLVRDLKDVAKSEPDQSRPLFLLAFIAYNTNSPQLAADYLAAAEKRGGSSEMYAQLRGFWKLPAARANGASQPRPDTAP